MDIFGQVAAKRKQIEEATKMNIQKSFVNEFNEEVKSVEKAEQSEFQKAYSELFGGVIEKAVYADTPQNRKLGRVGQEYHRGKGKKDNGVSEPKKRSENDGVSEKPKALTKNMQIKVNRISDAIKNAVKRRVFGSIHTDKEVDLSKVKVEYTGTYYKMSYNGETVQYFDRDSDFTPKAVKAAIATGFKTKFPF